MLSLQITNLIENKQLLPEVQNEFKTVKEFQMLSNSIKGVIKDFKKTSNLTYDLVLEREKGTYEVHARIFIPLDYPDSSPQFSLTMLKHSFFNLQFNPLVTDSLLSKID